MILRIATRQSPLALWQANDIKNRLLAIYPELRIQLVELITAGDKRTDIELTEIGGKSLFVKELQNALLKQEADIAVHCVKDMSVTHTPGLQLTAVCEREDPRDVLISPHFSDWRQLSNQIIVGTASPRRQSQLLAYCPTMIIKPLRGNVGTRLSKLDQGQFDAIILAAAGLKRLGLTDRIRQYLPLSEFLPAIGQGALGIECRSDDVATQSLVKSIDHWSSHQCIKAERAVNFRLGGDCYTPIGAHAHIENDILKIDAFVGHLAGEKIIRAHLSGPADQAERLGISLAEKLLAEGAGLLLNNVLDF